MNNHIFSHKYVKIWSFTSDFRLFSSCRLRRRDHLARSLDRLRNSEQNLAAPGESSIWEFPLRIPKMIGLFNGKSLSINGWELGVALWLRKPPFKHGTNQQKGTKHRMISSMGFWSKRLSNSMKHERCNSAVCLVLSGEQQFRYIIRCGRFTHERLYPAGKWFANKYWSYGFAMESNWYSGTATWWANTVTACHGHRWCRAFRLTAGPLLQTLRSLRSQERECHDLQVHVAWHSAIWAQRFPSFIGTLW